MFKKRAGLKQSFTYSFKLSNFYYN